MTHPLVAQLASEDPEQRRAACAAAAHDASAVLLADALCTTLGDPVHAVANAAGDALAEIGRRDDSVLRALDQALRGENKRARCYAALTYARLEPPPIKLMPALVDALASSEGSVRWSAAKHLVDMGRVHGEVLPVLLEYSVREPRRDARRMAVHALRELAPDHAETADALLTTTRDPDLVLRRASLAALASLLDPPPEIIERLVEVLIDDRDCASQRIAVTALGELGATSGQKISPAIETQIRGLADLADDPGLRHAATRALRRIAEAHPPHTP